jgi:tRNA A-37 threonylcarbamoyl transferase component Bud32
MAEGSNLGRQTNVLWEGCRNCLDPRRMNRSAKPSDPAPPGRQLMTHHRRLGERRHLALLLAMQGRHRDAAVTLLEELDTTAEGLSNLDDEGRRLVSVAATYLQKSGDAAAATALFAALGHSDRAALSRAQVTNAPTEPPSAAEVPSLQLPHLPPSPEVIGLSEPVPSLPFIPRPPGPTLRSPPMDLPLAPITVREPTDSAPASPAHELLLAEGTLIADRFVISEAIGRGGMATVYRARDQELDETVALKVFSGELVTRDLLEEAVERFRQELKLCRRLRHPNIVQVYDIGVFDGHRYFTMELLQGQSLERFLGMPREPRWLVQCLAQACDGLQAAHDQGVVHRDVKPENLFLTSGGQVKLMDFGIAKSAHRPGRTLTGTFAGTPEYMAPEQISDFSGVGPAADQYSLGVVGYHLLTGRPPFTHPDMMGVLMKHLQEAPLAPSSLVPAVPPSLEQLLLRMLCKDPAQRFSSCGEAGLALRTLPGLS